MKSWTFQVGGGKDTARNTSPHVSKLAGVAAEVCEAQGC